VLLSARRGPANARAIATIDTSIPNARARLRKSAGRKPRRADVAIKCRYRRLTTGYSRYVPRPPPHSPPRYCFRNVAWWILCVLWDYALAFVRVDFYSLERHDSLVRSIPQLQRERFIGTYSWNIWQRLSIHHQTSSVFTVYNRGA